MPAATRRCLRRAWTRSTDQALRQEAIWKPDSRGPGARAEASSGGAAAHGAAGHYLRADEAELFAIRLLVMAIDSIRQVAAVGAREAISDLLKHVRRSGSQAGALTPSMGLVEIRGRSSAGYAVCARSDGRLQFGMERPTPAPAEVAARLFAGWMSPQVSQMASPRRSARSESFSRASATRPHASTPISMIPTPPSLTPFCMMLLGRGRRSLPSIHSSRGIRSTRCSP